MSVFNTAVKFHCSSQLDFKIWQSEHSIHCDRKHRRTITIRLLSTKRDDANIMAESQRIFHNRMAQDAVIEDHNSADSQDFSSETTELCPQNPATGPHLSQRIVKTKLRGLSRPSGRRLSAKLLQTIADRGYHVVSVTDPYGRVLGFLDPGYYF
jgi:hypothetical protein